MVVIHLLIINLRGFKNYLKIRSILISLIPLIEIVTITLSCVVLRWSHLICPVCLLSSIIIKTLIGCILIGHFIHTIIILFKLGITHVLLQWNVSLIISMTEVRTRLRLILWLVIKIGCLLLIWLLIFHLRLDCFVFEKFIVFIFTVNLFWIHY